MNKVPDWFDSLDIEGWRPVLFILDPDKDHPCLMEAGDDIDKNDPAVLRREQWIVSGDQYVYAARDADGWWSAGFIGEHNYVGAKYFRGEVDDLEALLPEMKARLASVECPCPPRDIHPVLLELLHADPSYDLHKEQVATTLDYVTKGVRQALAGAVHNSAYTTEWLAQVEVAAQGQLTQLQERGAIQGGQVLGANSYDSLEDEEQHAIDTWRAICKAVVYGETRSPLLDKLLSVLHHLGPDRRWVYDLEWAAPAAEWNALIEKHRDAESGIDWDSFYADLPSLPGAYEVYKDPGHPQECLLVDIEIRPLYPLARIKVTIGIDDEGEE